MKMKNINVRMSETAWQEIQAHARQDGVSASEFVRECVYFRLGYRFAGQMVSDGAAAERLELLARVLSATRSADPPGPR